MTRSTAAKNSATEAAQNGNELREIPLGRLVPSKGNPRQSFDPAELDRLKHAIATRGFDHPILVRPSEREGYFEIIDGERRFRAAKAASLTHLPALVKTDENAPGSELLDAMLANGLGVSLDVVEEALGYQALIDDAGYTRKGIAEAFQIPLGRVRERLKILELPEPLRARLAAGEVPLLAVKTLASLHKVHRDLAALAIRRVLEGPAQDWDEPLRWEDLVADPISVLIGDYEEQAAELPSDVFVAWRHYPASRFELDEKAQEELAQLCELLELEPERVEVRFERDELDQANALGAGHLTANETHGIIVGADVASQLAGDYIARRLTTKREQPRGPRGAIGAEGKAGPHDAAEGAETLPEEQLAAQKALAREEARRLRDETIARNQRLGAVLVRHVARVKIDERAVKVLTAAPIAEDFSRITARGARLAFPGWAELSTRKNGSTKASYLSVQDAQAKAQEFLRGASSAAEIAGRSLALLAAARWAREEHAIAQSSATHYTLRLAPSWAGDDGGVPWRGEAEELLDEILIEKLPADVADPIREAKQARESQRAEEQRRERERDAVVAAFVKQAPKLTRDERHAEIQRLRGEYGFSAVPNTRGRELMELPEPAAA